jgi:TRAP-type C4-dicarboxylate transport system permease small subunit
MRLSDRAIEILAALGVAAYAAAALVTVADILGRRFGAPVAGVVDLVQLFVTAGTWAVIPWAFVAGAHVAVEFLTARLPARARRVLAGISALLAAAILVLMLRYGWDAFAIQARLGDRSQQLGIPIAWYWWPLLAGQAACLLALVSVLIRLRRGEPGP